LLALFDTTKKTWLAALNGHEVHSACGHLKTVKSLFYTSIIKEEEEEVCVWRGFLTRQQQRLRK
jgi:hypothetical protein